MKSAIIQEGLLSSVSRQGQAKLFSWLRFGSRFRFLFFFFKWPLPCKSRHVYINRTVCTLHCCDDTTVYRVSLYVQYCSTVTLLLFKTRQRPYHTKDLRPTGPNCLYIVCVLLVSFCLWIAAFRFCDLVVMALIGDKVMLVTETVVTRTVLKSMN